MPCGSAKRKREKRDNFSRKTKKKGKTAEPSSSNCKEEAEPSSNRWKETPSWLKGRIRRTSVCKKYDPAIHRQKYSIYDEEYRNEYIKQLSATSAFDITVSPPVGKYPPCSWIMPVSILQNKTDRIILNFLADFALQQYNSLHTEEGNYVFTKLVKATFRGGRGFEYFITFLAEDATQGVKTFQAAVLHFVTGAKVTRSCELKPTN